MFISKHRVWIIEDDIPTQMIYSDILSHRYPVDFFTETRELDDAVTNKLVPSLLIADLRLGSETFVNYLPKFKKRLELRCPPIIVVSSLDDLDVVKFCFQHGVTDFISKPFGRAELLYKVERVIDGSAIENLSSTLKLHPETYTISKMGSHTEPFTPKEFQIIHALFSAPGRLLSRKELNHKLWKEVSVVAKTLDVHLMNIRRKLSPLNIEIESTAPNSFRLLDERVSAASNF